MVEYPFQPHLKGKAAKLKEQKRLEANHARVVTKKDRGGGWQVNLSFGVRQLAGRFRR
ncbi:hypothetical protein ACFFP0_26620 [Rhizobium puerariae]|uniref:Transposase n=1 Tax=Rhizobium puerariae TaxID=1585791 RepID=A0ABV6ASY4_9HYPH